MAVVAAAPAYAAASAYWDASITADCTSGLLTATSRVGFTITNVGTATMPTGTEFVLKVGGLVNADVFTNSGDLINLYVAGLVQVGPVTVFPLATQSPVPPGGTATVTLPSSLVDAKVLTTYELDLVTTEPTGASSSNNSAAFGYTNVSLGSADVIALCS